MTQLLTCLQNLEQDRGAMAALRHALSEQQQRCYKYLARMGCKFESDLDMLRFEILAYCWGHHSSHSEAVGNLGRSMRRITGGDEDHSFNRRFERLLACDSLDEVAEQVNFVRNVYVLVLIII